MSSLIAFDRKLLDRYPVIFGMDEAGRGSWAGPVVTCCFALTDARIDLYEEILVLANDSKKLSKKKRSELYDQLQKMGGYMIRFSGCDIIDNSDITDATMRAFDNGLRHLCQDYRFDQSLAVMDGNFWRWTTPDSAHPGVQVTTLVKGDSKSCAVACASIMAKVWRDRYMEDMALIFPGYGFENHAGYGTKAHQEALRKLGVSDFHRKSFEPMKSMLEESSYPFSSPQK